MAVATVMPPIDLPRPVLNPQTEHCGRRHYLGVLKPHMKRVRDLPEKPRDNALTS